VKGHDKGERAGGQKRGEQWRRTEKNQGGTETKINQ